MTNTCTFMYHGKTKKKKKLSSIAVFRKETYANFSTVIKNKCHFLLLFAQMTWDRWRYDMGQMTFWHMSYFCSCKCRLVECRKATKSRRGCANFLIPLRKNVNICRLKCFYDNRNLTTCSLAETLVCWYPEFQKNVTFADNIIDLCVIYCR